MKVKKVKKEHIQKQKVNLKRVLKGLHKSIVLYYMVELKSTGYKPPALTYKSTKYAQSKNPVLPSMYFVSVFCGPRGGGKTFSATQLIKAYEESPPIDTDNNKHAIRTFIISPTFEQNECFKALKSLDMDDVYLTYSPDVLEEILAKIKAEEEAIKEYKEKLALWKKFKRVKSETDLNKLLEKEGLMCLFNLDMDDFQEPEPPRYPNGVSNILVIDDMIGSSIFSNGKNAFTHLLLKNRHHRLAICIMSQNLKSIPKAIRGNCSLWWVGKFGSPKPLLEELYDEIASGSCTFEQFEQYYKTATDRDYGSLVVDFSKPKDKRFSINFVDYLQ